MDEERSLQGIQESATNYQFVNQQFVRDNREELCASGHSAYACDGAGWIAGTGYSNENLIFIDLMRNTTKLKQLLLKFDLDLSMEDDGLMKLTLVDKITGKATRFEHSSYSTLIGKSHSFFLKGLKMETGSRNKMEK